MGVIVPVGGSNAVMRWSLLGDSEPMVCTLGIIDELVTDDPVDIAGRFATAFAASGVSDNIDLGQGWSRMTSFVTTILSSGPVTVEAGTAVANTGTHSTPPNNCAYLIRKQTALGGRRNRGRMFVPPYRWPETDVTPNGVLGTSQVTTMQAEWTSFMTQLATQDLSPVIWHEDGSAGTQITGLVVQPRMATQRTRMRR